MAFFILKQSSFFPLAPITLSFFFLSSILLSEFYEQVSVTLSMYCTAIKTVTCLVTAQKGEKQRKKLR